MIFIGFTNYDEAAAHALAVALRSAGVDVYCSAVSGTIKGGSFWQQIEHAIDTCDAFIELCGTNPPSKSSESEIVTANNRLARGSKFLIVPVLLPGVAPSAIHISLRAYECVELTVDPQKFSAADKSEFVERLRGLGALSSSLSSKSAARAATQPQTSGDAAPIRSTTDTKPGSKKLWMVAAVSLVVLAGVGYLAWQNFGPAVDSQAREKVGERPSPNEGKHEPPPATNDRLHDGPTSTDKPADKPDPSTEPAPTPAPTPEPVKVSKLDPYAGWKLPNAQAGLKELGRDRETQLEEFALENSGSIPWRDGNRELVVAARPALEDPKCALVLVLIPAGSYLMGSTEHEGIDNERPQHSVDIKPFFIAKTEVTQALWDRVMRSGGSKSLLPVTDISWAAAGEFCNKLGLARPTEAQWEYACRAGTTTAFSFGDDVRELSKYAWPKNDADPRAREIAGKLPNRWGLYDMLGNVSEWCEDSFVPQYNFAPFDGSAFVEPSNVRRAMRGGNFTFNDDFMRSAARGMYNGSKGAAFVGFRPARPVRD